MYRLIRSKIYYIKMMASIQWLINKLMKIPYFLSLALVVTPAALASYVPPSDQQPVPPERRSDGGTTRGCNTQEEMSLTLLAPQNHVGQTISQRPTFAWFLRGSGSFEVKFAIDELVPGSNQKKEIHAKSFKSSSGMTKLVPFSKDEPGLEVGKDYVWRVVVYCEPGKPTIGFDESARIKVVEMPPALPSQVDKAATSAEKANIYAQAGMWYDALGEALNLVPASQLGELGSALLQDLARLEASQIPSKLTREAQERIEQRIKQLKQIANNK
ncbi:MAG TPA: hypothetical protein DCE56_00150 [Cyanobacteria bacterium UBA8553]|nr:hypothetical protein [Cyanobacteria bacterium UBA8553]